MKKKLYSILLHLKKRHGSLQTQNAEKYIAIKKYILAFIVFVFLGISLSFIILLIRLPDIDNIENIVAAQSSVILDREGGILYTIHGDENRTIIPLNQISEHVQKATLAIEDDQFYNHQGIDIGAILKAICSEMHLCSARGGSTITQQYVKNAFLSPERTYSRKLKEIILSLNLERKYTKDNILEMYLNRIPYGSNIYGVEVAAQKFFDKPASDLSLAESAILASIPKSTTYYFPYGNHKYVQINLDEKEILRMDINTEKELVSKNPDFITKGLLGKTYIFGEESEEGDEGEEHTKAIYVKGRVDFVLQRMYDLGYISDEEHTIALEEANNIEFSPFREDITAPHFVLYVRELLEEKYGREIIEKGGLKITTTIDPKMQEAADKVIEKYGERNEEIFRASNASLVALDTNTGQILAMVGSRDFWNDEIDGKVNVALRPRLPGSSFKPIVYATAFLQGYAPSTVIYDVKTKFGAWYEPENFDGQFRGPVTMRQALGASLNIPAVKSAYLAGIPNVLDIARKMGINLNQPDSWYGLSLGLGAGEARLIDMVGAYSIFANGGYKNNPVTTLKVEDRNGNILEEYKKPDNAELVLDSQIAYLINDILSDTSARPDEYWRNQLTIPGHVNGAKTGTSNKKKNEINYPFDTWTIGYTRNLAAGVWAGNADGKHLSLKASGLDVAGPIWREFMTEALKDSPNTPFERPEEIKWIKVAKRSGKLPSANTPEEEVTNGIFASFSIPREYDNSYQVVEIDKVSGKLATEFTPKKAREEKAYYSHHSILPENTNWEKAVRKWAEDNNQDEQPPTEYDDIHTSDNAKEKPQILIKYPVQKSTISPPYIGVWSDINSAVGINRVDYYWDDMLISTSNKPPYKGNIEIPGTVKKGSVHTIKAIVIDTFYNSSQASVTIKIGTDTTKPLISFIYPSRGKNIPINSSIPVQVEAYDPNGDIKKIEFYLDNKLADTISKPPYIWQFKIPSLQNRYTIKAIAYDHAGNTSHESITINAKQISSTITGETRILKPTKNSSFDEGEYVLIKAFLTKEEREILKEITVYAKKDNTLPVEIKKTQDTADIYTFIWDAPPAGTYELYLKIILDNGKIRFTKRVPIVVR